MQCSMCQTKAVYECLKCKLKFCEGCVYTSERKSFPRCLNCKGKLYKIGKIFIGSSRPMLKYSPLRKFYQKPRIIHKGKPYHGDKTFEEKE